MKYFIKVDGLVVVTKNTNRSHDGEILYIDWVTDFLAEVQDGEYFNEEEMNYMKNNYENVEVFEVK